MKTWIRKKINIPKQICGANWAKLKIENQKGNFDYLKLIWISSLESNDLELIRNSKRKLFNWISSKKNTV